MRNRQDVIVAATTSTLGGLIVVGLVAIGMQAEVGGPTGYDRDQAVAIIGPPNPASPSAMH
jgi:hypothetical protein